MKNKRKAKVFWFSGIILVLAIGTWIGVWRHQKNAAEKNPVTGWDYDSTNGGFEKVPYDDDGQGPGLIFIEGGTFTMGKVDSTATDTDSAAKKK